MIIDSHAHICDDRLYPRAGEIHDGLTEAGIAAVINVGYDAESSEKCVALAEEYPLYFAAVGIHPHDAVKARAEDYDRFTELSRHGKVVALGEIGLDFYYDLSPREVQKRVFLEQLELACSLKLPAIIHLRDAYGAMLSLLRENLRLTEYGILLHCYGGSKEMLTEFASLGAYFAFGGAITFKNAVDKPDIVRRCPADRLLTETDCPYMTPVPYRGRDNEPKHVNLVASRLCEILGTDRETLENTTLSNTKRFFGRLNDSI